MARDGRMEQMRYQEKFSRIVRRLEKSLLVGIGPIASMERNYTSFWSWPGER